MPDLHFAFELEAPLEAVAAFHQDTRVLKKLTPPPIFVQLHQVEPLGEGSRSTFTMWFGPFSCALDSCAYPGRPPARFYRYSGKGSYGSLAPYSPVRSDQPTANSRARDHLEFSYRAWSSRLDEPAIFNSDCHRLLFVYRAWATRRGVHSIGGRGDKAGTLDARKTPAGALL